MRTRTTVATAIAMLFLKMTSKVRWVILAYVATRLLAALLFHLIEGWTFAEGWWWGEVASLTIGYGDIAPKTTTGRLLAMPFHFFWVYYINLALGAHLITFLIRNAHVLTHHEQEWLFQVVTVMFGWMRWCVISLNNMAATWGFDSRVVPPIPHTDSQGVPMHCPEQAPDTDHDATEASSRR